MLNARDRDSLILAEVMKERVWQDTKFGADRMLTVADWWAIVCEEFGEAAHEYTDQHFETEGHKRISYLVKLRHELLQTAASCVAMMDGIDRHYGDLPLFVTVQNQHDSFLGIKHREFLENRNAVPGD